MIGKIRKGWIALGMTLALLGNSTRNAEASSADAYSSSILAVLYAYSNYANYNDAYAYQAYFYAYHAYVNADYAYTKGYCEVWQYVVHYSYYSYVYSYFSYLYGSHSSDAYTATKYSGYTYSNSTAYWNIVQTAYHYAYLAYVYSVQNSLQSNDRFANESAYLLHVGFLYAYHGWYTHRNYFHNSSVYCYYGSIAAGNSYNYGAGSSHAYNAWAYGYYAYLYAYAAYTG